MEDIYFYLAASGMLTVLLWIPYILARAYVWGIPSFLKNYPPGYPENEPVMPTWAVRSQKAHTNMVETLPAFVAVVIAAISLGSAEVTSAITSWTAVFFYARLAHVVIYTAGIAYLRTPAYLASWLAVLMIGAQVVL